jgi:dihydrofolate synthase / folylpolyglutamate synthase
VHAVLGVLRDKEPAAIAAPLAGKVAGWHIGQTADARAMPADDLYAALHDSELGAPLRAYPSIAAALDGAAAAAVPGDCVLVFGSFTTVEAALKRSG